MIRMRTAIAAALFAFMTGADSIPSIEARTTQRKRPTAPEQVAQNQTSCFARGAVPRQPLLAAAYRGDVATINRLVAGGTDVNLKDKNGDDALILAADYGHGEAIKLLLEKGADAKSKNSVGGTALMAAACRGDLESVKALIEKGADVNARSQQDATALTMALKGNPESEQIFRLLLDKGAEVPKSAILEAVSGSSLSIVQQLLDRNVDLEVKGEFGQTPLMIAAKAGRVDIVKALLAKGADTNAKRGIGVTALMLAAEENRIAVVEALINGGADVGVEDEDGDTALDYAEDPAIREMLNRAKGGLRPGVTVAADDIHSLVKKGDVVKLKELLRKDPSAVNKRDTGGENMLPLHYAAGLGKAEIVAELLANKADVDGKTGNGLTALSIVTRGSNMSVDVIRILLENGADPNDGRGHATPLHNAIAFQNVEAVKLLLKYKADVNAKYLGTESVLKLAGKNQEIINLLRAHGAK